MLTDEAREGTPGPDSERTSQPDSAEQLPHIYERLDVLADRVANRSLAGLVLFDCTSLEDWEADHGASSFDRVISRLGSSIREALGEDLREEDLVCRDAPGGESIILFVSSARNEPNGQFDRPAFDDIADRTREYVLDRAADPEENLPRILDRIQTGTALVVGKETVDPRRELYRAIRRARLDIREGEERRRRRQREVVNHVISQKKVDTVYQPIVTLADQSCVGFEALSRPCRDVESELGGKLFRAAEKAALAPELDQLCRRLSVDRRPELDRGAKLFVNCLPAAFLDPEEGIDKLVDYWNREGLEERQLVFEINEHISQSQADRILPTIRRLRKRGCQFALDDVGTGKTNLRLLADLEPDFIKMDISLTRGIAESVRKKALASYLLDLARKGDAALIAEGVETTEDYRTVADLNIDYGQGHAIAPPTDDGSLCNSD